MDTGFDFYFSGPAAIFGTILKVIMISSAIISAVLIARDFVNGEVETTLKKRIRISVECITKDEVLTDWCRNHSDDYVEKI